MLGRPSASLFPKSSHKSKIRRLKLNLWSKTASADAECMDENFVAEQNVNCTMIRSTPQIARLARHAAKSAPQKQQQKRTFMSSLVAVPNKVSVVYYFRLN